MQQTQYLIRNQSSVKYIYFLFLITGSCVEFELFRRSITCPQQKAEKLLKKSSFDFILVIKTNKKIITDLAKADIVVSEWK